MNSKINELYGFDSKLAELAAQAEKNCAEAFAKIDATAEYCGAKVLKAFSDNKVSDTLTDCWAGLYTTTDTDFSSSSQSVLPGTTSYTTDRIGAAHDATHNSGNSHNYQWADGHVETRNQYQTTMGNWSRDY